MYLSMCTCIENVSVVCVKLPSFSWLNWKKTKEHA